MTTDVGIDALRTAVEGMHSCRATYRELAHVREEHEGQLVWDGDVYVFDLEGHPTASTCYAWSSPVEGSDRRRVFAVLHQSPVDSAEKAVRASIAQACREELAENTERWEEEGGS
jgi:hypothetical protein